MTFGDKVETVAQALWSRRADEVSGWKETGWPSFCVEKPDIAAIYRDNARVAVEAIEKMEAA